MNIAVLVLALGLSTTLVNCNHETEINLPSKNGVISIQDYGPYKLLSRIRRNIVICSKSHEESCYDEIDTEERKIESIDVPPDVESPRPRFRRGTRCESGTEVVGCYICACNEDRLTYDICFPLQSCRQPSL